MGLPGRTFRAAQQARRTARFRAWATTSRLRLRAAGVKLVIDAPHGADFETAPDLQPMPHHGARPGDAPPTITLRLGRDVRLGRGLTIEYRAEGDSLIELGDGTHLEDSVRFIVGDGTIRLGPRVRVRSFSVLKSYGELTLGERAILSYNCVLHCEQRIDMHDLVGLAERVTVIDSTHTVDGSDTYYFQQPTKSEPIVLERNVIVSANAMILRGAHVERNAQIGAAALVRKGRYPAGWLTGGTPAKPIRPLEAAGASDRAAAAEAGQA